jgi:bifunctional N-acetylglucosamine-1-phosphate-uridyltransferase/glucosamine-1-phosphate-acetyltransferase GlmU-like protein
MIDPSASVASSASVGEGTRVWGLAQVRERAVLGANCIVGRGAYVGPGVQVGDAVKIQNLAQLHEPAQVASGAFIGPAAVLTNDEFPRAVNPDGSSKSATDWKPVGVLVEEGASIGANAVCVAPVRIGRWALVGAGSTVVDDVADFALVVGTPARRVGWVGKAGRPLERAADGTFRCPATGTVYHEDSAGLSEVATP